MSFLRSRKFKGSKPISKSANTAVVSSNGRVVNPFQDTSNSSSRSTTSHSKQPPPPSSSQVITVPHSNSDLPNARKMIVLQEYHPNQGDSKGLLVRRGETVMVLSQDQDWYHVRNERSKEGFVPCAHLVAPYSTMRSGRQKFSGGPIRPVASGSSIDVMDHSIHGVPMFPSRSAGRPRNYSMGDDNRIHSNYNHSMTNVQQQRVYSPQEMGYGHHANGPAPPPPPPPPPPSHGYNSANPANSYDQKYSPSTSSGVASLTGTGSPVGHSDGSQHSSLCSIEEDRGREREREGGEGAPASLQNGVSENSREFTQMKGRATSETNIAYKQHGKPPVLLPPQSVGHPSTRERPLSSDQPHLEAGVAYNEEDIPPPLPPRSLYYNINPPPPQNVPPGETYIPPPEEYSNSQEESDPYAAPVDAIPRNPSPHLGNQPHVQSVNDMRPRRDNIKAVDDNGVYTEVFQGYQRPQQRLQNGYHLSPSGVEEGMYSIPPSEVSSSHSRSSRQSGSRVSSLRTQTTEPYNNSRELMLHESDLTLNGDRNEGMGREYIHHPHSANAQIITGSGPIKTFRKNLWGLYTVTDYFEACDENEVNVQEGDHVSVWNQDDPEWYWIVKHDTNEEGFVPSGCLKEIGSDTHSISRSYNTTEIPHHQILSEHSGEAGNGGTSSVPPPPLSSVPPPPLPPRQMQIYPKPPTPKPPRPPPTGGSYDHTHHRFRDRCTSQITSHDSRPSSIPPPINAGGGGYGRRRLNSDGNGPPSLRGQSSASSIDRREPSISPPNSPPPPYSKYDHNQSHHTQHQNHAHIPPPPLPTLTPTAQPPPPRHYSLSQHERTGHTHAMQRTWSHGQVPYRKVHIPHSNGGSGRPGEEDARGDGIISPPDIFAESDGGTLV